MLDYTLSEHAEREMQRRGIGASVVSDVLTAPQQRFFVREGREVFQSRLEMDGLRYLVRVFVDVDRHPVEVVTVYRTSKIKKYWRRES